MVQLLPASATFAASAVGAAVAYYCRDLKLDSSAAKPLAWTAAAVAVGQLASNFIGLIARGQADKDNRSTYRYGAHVLAAGGLAFAAKTFFKISDKEALASFISTTIVFLVLSGDKATKGNV